MANCKNQPHVCVIGAGVCGIISVKICLENNLKVTCYDKSSTYGGLWQYKPDEKNQNGSFEPSVMRTTILNTSKELSAFSDFPPPAKLANFMRHNHYMDYISSYVKHFKLLPHLNLEHQILSCKPEWKLDENTNNEFEIKWLVTVENLKTGEILNQKFDRLMVAVGHHNIPYEPVYKNQTEFKGEILHSARLKNILSNEKFVDKNVLVVGFGNSACDAANDIAMVANKCYVSCHRGQWFTSRFLIEGPYDFRIKSRMYNYLDGIMPSKFMDRLLVNRIEQRTNHYMLGLKPAHKPSEQVPAINDLFPYRIYTGGITLKGSIKTFTKTGVIFEGEEEEDCPIDVVVLATGYQAKIPFLDEFQLGIKSCENNNDEYQLFLNIFAPLLKIPQLIKVDNETLENDNNNNNNSNGNDNTPKKFGQIINQNGNQRNTTKTVTTKDQYKCVEFEDSSNQLKAIKSLAFVGLVQPNGSMTVISELQARYAALVFTGQRDLPKMKTMLKHMKQTRKMRAKSIRSHSRDQLIGSYVGYMETIARLIGVRPNLAKLFFTDHKLWKQLMFGPCVPYQYRLTGPGYWLEARQTTLATRERVYCGINEGKNHILYKSRMKCLTDASVIDDHIKERKTKKRS